MDNRHFGQAKVLRCGFVKLFTSQGLHQRIKWAQEQGISREVESENQSDQSGEHQTKKDIVPAELWVLQAGFGA